MMTAWVQLQSSECQWDVKILYYYCMEEEEEETESKANDWFESPRHG